MVRINVTGWLYLSANKTNFVTIVDRRDKDTLIKIILKFAVPDLIVVTDCWGGYAEVKKYFRHLTVNHKYHFVNPINKKIHTQTIERFWGTVKTFLKNNTSHEYKLINILNCLYEEKHKNIEECQKFNLFICYLNYFTRPKQCLDDLLNG